MDGRHHKITAHSAEGHEVHVCHRCGWPFPNLHPSAKHRRAHKRVCGKVEGYEIIHSDDRVTVSDDDHASDDEHHTPSPNIVEKNPESSSRVGDKLEKSEDDLFSDAVTEFSDNGISPRVESVRELSKCLEKKRVEEVEEATDITKSSNSEPLARSEEMSKSEPLGNRNNQPDNVILITNTATELVSFGLTNDSQPEHSVGGCVHGQDADIQVQEQGKVLGGTTAVVESQDELCDKLASDEAKHDPFPPSESLQTVDASQGVNSVVHFAERSSSTKTVETCESTKSFSDASASGNFDVTEESNNLNSIDANSALGSSDNNTSMAKKETSETGNEKGEGASVEVEVISDSTIAIDIDAKGLQELSKINSSSMESIDEVTGVLQSVDSVGDMSAVVSELANNNDVVKNGIGFKSENGSEIREDENEVLASGHSVSNKESAVSDSVLLSENVASCIREDDKVSESIEETVKDYESSVVTGGNSESPSSPKVEKTDSSNFQAFHGNSDVTSVNAKPMLTDKPTKQTENASEIDSITSRSDSLEANCGSVVSDTIETNSKKHKTRSPNKSDTFEPPSFMTLVQSGAEIERLQKNQEPQSDALQAGWFPSLTNNVINESEGRKKNEEMIAKVTNWSPVKQQHNPLKSLLSEEVKSPNMTNHKVEEDETSKHVEEWNSPARYPIQIKKEKKGRPFWVPFVCCSSAHRDL